MCDSGIFDSRPALSSCALHICADAAACDVTNVKIMTRFLANLTPPGEDIRNLFELRFTSTCAFNLTNAIFSYCWNFATYSPNGLPNPLSASSCTPTAPGFRDVDVKVNGQLWSDVFCRLQLNQGTCRGSNPPVQLLPGQSVSLFYVDLTRYMLCAYDVTFDTGAKDTRSLDTNLANPRSCAPDTPPATCLPSSLKNVYCKPGNFKLYSPSCSKAKWC